MEFRLVFQGNLIGSSNKKNRTYEKHQIRRAFHPQMRRLWETKSKLKDFAERVGVRALTEERSVIENDCSDAELFASGISKLSGNWERNGFRFLPLVAERFCLRCSLNILFLRPEESGMLIQGGDIDNRLKTLFDALRMPNNLSETGNQKPDENETPFFVLLEDDSLVSEIRVVTDQLLLLPKEREISPQEALLVITVKVEVTQPMQYEWVFAQQLL